MPRKEKKRKEEEEEEEKEKSPLFGNWGGPGFLLLAGYPLQSVSLLAGYPLQPLCLLTAQFLLALLFLLPPKEFLLFEPILLHWVNTGREILGLRQVQANRTPGLEGNEEGQTLKRSASWVSWELYWSTTSSTTFRLTSSLSNSLIQRTDAHL